jgi:hypothetical protein
LAVKPDQPFNMNSRNQLDAGSSARFWVKAAIHVFEASYFLRGPERREPSISPHLIETVNAVQQEFEQMQRSGEEPLAESQAALAVELVLRHKFPTVLCCHRHTPLAAVIRLVAVASSIPWRRLVEGRLEESDFPRLTVAAHKLAWSSLRMADGRGICSLAVRAEVFAFHREPRMVILDWEPPQCQWDGLQEMSARRNLTLLFPRSGQSTLSAPD